MVDTSYDATVSSLQNGSLRNHDGTVTGTGSRRRSSLLDYGGENSLNRLIKSIDRSNFSIYADDNGSAEELETLLSADGDSDDERSTVFQTVFNSINILIGIGLLSLPLAFKLSGLIGGVVGLVACAVVTQYTATLLGRCYIKDNRYRNYNELGRELMGDRYNFIVLVLFNMDLIGAIVALILLFADSFNTILSVQKTYLKFFIVSLLFGLNHLSLRVLSVLSLVGILCTNGIIVITIFCGVYKHDSPGSLLQPQLTRDSLFPSTLQNSLISISIMMSNFGGHAVLPEFINDMRDPTDSVKSFRIAFAFTLFVDMVIAIIGFLMFGPEVQDEFTQNLMLTPGYPTWCNAGITLAMGLLPISKLPLISRPIIVYLESHFGDSAITKLWIKASMSVAFFLLSTWVTDFGKMMALLGGFICFSICITLPLLFYIKIFANDLDPWWKSSLLFGVGLSILFTLAGTIATLI